MKPACFQAFFGAKKLAFLTQRVPEKEPPASSLEWVKSLQKVNPWFCGKAGRAINPPFLGAKGVKSLRRGNPLFGGRSRASPFPKTSDLLSQRCCSLSR